jgi:hypothetical protein
MQWLKRLGLDKMFLSIVQLMPNYLPMNKIRVEISSFDSNKWMDAPKFNDDKYCTKDELPLIEDEKKVLGFSYFGCCKVPIEMDERIIESGLKVLENNQEIKSKLEMKAKKKANREHFEKRLWSVLGQKTNEFMSKDLM